MVVDTDTNDQKDSHRNIRSECRMSNIKDQRKQKMKLKAAKVLKFLLNFLQIKPKNKYGKEKLSARSGKQYDVAKNINVEAVNEYTSLITKPSDTPFKMIDNGMSLSWSYLVHDPFSNLEGCAHTEHLDNGGIFYNESYFEDDYCQDFYEHNDTQINQNAYSTPDLKLDSYRLFEPQRTPCGEFKRNSSAVVPTRRRHLSLPNISSENSDILHTNILDIDINSDDLLDYNQIVCSQPPVGLNIAFDNFLDETNMNSSKMLSMNHVQLLPYQEISMDKFAECEIEHDQIMKYVESEIESGSNNVKEYLETSEESGSISSNKQIDFTITSETFGDIGQSPAYIMEKSYEDQISYTSVVSSLMEKLPDMDAKFGCYTQLCFDRCMPDMSNASSMQNNHSGKKEQLKYLTDTQNTKKMLPGQSLESGYNSSDSLSHVSLDSGMAPEVVHAAGYDISETVQGSIPDFKPHNKHFKNRFKPSAFPLPNKTVNWSTNTCHLVPTSSPNQVLNTLSLSRRNLASMPYFISPIRQKSTVPKLRQKSTVPKLRTMDHDGSFKRKIRHKKRDILVGNCSYPKDSNLDVNSNLISEHLEDYNLLMMAADFIVNRIQFTDELTTYIDIEQLIHYLNSYYTAEVSKLANRNVKTIADYKKFVRESLDIFTSDRLTQENCFQELLLAVLGNKSKTVSMCEDYIFENLQSVVCNPNYLQAAPELILMLLFNDRCVPLQLLGYKQFRFEVERAMRKYLEAHQTDLEAYSRLNRMFSLAIDRSASANLTVTVAKSVPVPITVAKMKKQAGMKLGCSVLAQRGSLHRDSGFNLATTNGVKYTYSLKLLDVSKRTNLRGESQVYRETKATRL